MTNFPRLKSVKVARVVLFLQDVGSAAERELEYFSLQILQRKSRVHENGTSSPSIDTRCRKGTVMIENPSDSHTDSYRLLYMHTDSYRPTATLTYTACGMHTDSYLSVARSVTLARRVAASCACRCRGRRSGWRRRRHAAAAASVRCRVPCMRRTM